MANSERRKNIAKNTIMLYIRMIVNMLIGFYTSRVVLRTLGVEDFGIYGVVSGVLVMFTFLNASMSGATSRFLTYELGQGNKKRLAETFSTALILHIFIAIVIALLCESVGIWFINNKLVIPSDRLIAAHWVFQFAVISMFIGVTQVPYNSIIFSYERMDVFAYVEIVRSVLSLLIVYLLVIGDFDKLILFAVLNFVVGLLIAMYYRYYCVSRFNECKFHWIWDKKLLKEMLAFSGWDLYGSLSVMARTQGINMLLNMFFGPIMNAATEIATRVQDIIMNLSTNVSVASRPQIVKNYAQDNHSEMLSLMRDGARMTFVLMMFFSLPLMVDTHYVLSLWLEEVPPNAELICVLTLLWNIVVAMNITVNYAVQATACVRRVSIICGTLFLAVIPVSYICLVKGLGYWIPFAFNVFAVIVAPFIGGGPVLKKKIRNYSIFNILLKDNVRDWCALIISGAVVFFIHSTMQESFVRLVLTTIASTVMILLTGYFIVWPSDRRTIIKQLLKEKIWNRNR